MNPKTGKLAGNGVATLSIVVDGDEPPTEFRLFTAGPVDTRKGEFLFDRAAAESVMADYQRNGVELMVDYDHASLAGLSIDPALAGKAAGWFNLEVRSGELWAVNVRWTEPAADALRRKEWRYMSPAFTTDDEGRVTSLLNVAITNIPATRRLQPLMAASHGVALAAIGGCMDPAQVQKALDAIESGDSAAALDILKALIASAAAGGDPDAGTEDAPPPAGDGGADEGVEAGVDPNADPNEEKKAEVMAATARLARLTGKDTIVSAIDEVEIWRASHLKLEAETAKLAKERTALELGKRKENAIALTKLGAETPHTTGLAKGKLCKRLAEEPLDEQNERVAQLLAARGGKMPTDPSPPPSGAPGANEFQTPHGLYTLSAREAEMCARKKIDPAKYAANRAAIRARNVNGADQ